MLLVDDLTWFVELPTITEVSSSCSAFWKIKISLSFSLCLHSVLAGGCPGPNEVVKLDIGEAEGWKLAREIYVGFPERKVEASFQTVHLTCSNPR